MFSDEMIEHFKSVYFLEYSIKIISIELEYKEPKLYNEILETKGLSPELIKCLFEFFTKGFPMLDLYKQVELFLSCGKCITCVLPIRDNCLLTILADFDTEKNSDSKEKFFIWCLDIARYIRI